MTKLHFKKCSQKTLIPASILHVKLDVRRAIFDQAAAKSNELFGVHDSKASSNKMQSSSRPTLVITIKQPGAKKVVWYKGAANRKLGYCAKTMGHDSLGKLG